MGEFGIDISAQDKEKLTGCCDQGLKHSSSIKREKFVG
jgi:hypothetical protein